MPATPSQIARPPASVQSKPDATKLFYARCSFSGKRGKQEVMGSFTFLQKAADVATAMVSLVDSIKALRREERVQLPSVCKVFVEEIYEVLDPLDVGLIFAIEEEEAENRVRVARCCPIPAGYESRVYEVGEWKESSPDEFSLVPVVSFPERRRKLKE